MITTGGFPPEGMEWQPGKCPNVGGACFCTGACRGKLVRKGTVKHCSTCRCEPLVVDDQTAGCPCRPENGGSGVCGCTLGGPQVTC